MHGYVVLHNLGVIVVIRADFANVFGRNVVLLLARVQMHGEVRERIGHVHAKPTQKRRVSWMFGF